MYLLVDLANSSVFRGVHRPNRALVSARLDEFIGRLGDCVAASLPKGFHELHFRLYDGWYDADGSGTDLCGMVRSHIQAAYPTLKRRFRFFVRVADAPAAVPTDRLIDTFRSERGLDRLTVSFFSPPASCIAPADCSFDNLRGWFKGTCPHSQKCSVSACDIAAVAYQKLVDTAIVADAVWYATNGHPLAIVSDDEDVIPGLVTARSFGGFVAWISRRSRPRAPYASLIWGRGIEFLTC